ncbi:PRC-barrel domain-containing protein [Nocardia higoensis]|uniref:PRC-barrel domain-containing protein n=1 Tax=Nocardia higoensis TaxID=228599 RepID=UPI0003173563|nr:PRC-barrel domain-containing protein [Nocardia higoensis]
MTQSTLDSLLDSMIIDADGARIGKVKQIYVDNDSGSPTWVAVSTGWFSGDSLVPLAGARPQGEKGDLRVRVRKAQVKSAPRLDSDGRLSRDAETELFSHYGLAPRSASRDAGEGRHIRPDADTPMTSGRADVAPHGRRTARSEEQLVVGADSERPVGKHRRRTEDPRDRW